MVSKTSHQREHQQEVTFNEGMGNVLKIARQEYEDSGMIFHHFVCPYCLGAHYNTGTSLTRHMKKCPDKPLQAPIVQEEHEEPEYVLFFFFFFFFFFFCSSATSSFSPPPRFPEDEELQAPIAADAAGNIIYLGDKAEISENETTIKLQVCVNTKYRVVTCIHPSCGYVLSTNWTTHLKTLHKVSVTGAENITVDELLLQAPQQVPPPVVGKDINMIPVQGLKLHSGFACAHCEENECCFVSRRSGETHNSKVHRGEKLAIEPCHFQTAAKKGSLNFRVCVFLQQDCLPRAKLEFVINR